jgi:hypothetical protein
MSTTSQIPPSAAPSGQAAQNAGPANQSDAAGSEFKNLLSYFKYLVTLTMGAIGVMIAVAGFLFYSNLKDVREEAKQQATRVATAEAKSAVAQAFEEKHINELILIAAQNKVGAVSDKLIEQQLTSKLAPIQKRIALIGQISESGARMRLGIRAGLDELNSVLKDSNDADVQKFTKSTLETIGQDYEDRVQEGIKTSGVKGMMLLQTFMQRLGRQQSSLPSNLHMVVETINHDSDLNVVATAFVAFRELTGETVKMFDFGFIKLWCSQNQSKCQSP